MDEKALEEIVKALQLVQEFRKEVFAVFKQTINGYGGLSPGDYFVYHKVVIVNDPSAIY